MPEDVSAAAAFATEIADHERSIMRYQVKVRR